MDNAQAFATATGTNNYIFPGGDNTPNIPELVITTIPEPSAAGLMLGGVASLMLLRRRRR